MIISEIQSDLHATEIETAIYDRINFNLRAEAIDFIDFHIIDRIDGLLQKEDLKEQLDLLRIRATKLKSWLEQINTDLFQQLRNKIRTANCKELYFKTLIEEYLGTYDSYVGQTPRIGYDNLDIFINGLLFDKPIPPATRATEKEMVLYQKTPARIIFEMVETAKIKQDDVFFDLGSGIGQAVLLVNLLSGVTAKGIEYEPAYCDYARASASALNLSNVEFITADAREADYSQATIFFMYTPFEGKMLQDMLNILQKVSQSRAIKIFSYGPCSTYLAQQNWLSCINGKAGDPYKLYEFRTFA